MSLADRTPSPCPSIARWAVTLALSTVALIAVLGLTSVSAFAGAGFHTEVPGESIYSYDSSSAHTTAAANARSGAFRVYDTSTNSLRARTPASGRHLAAKATKGTARACSFSGPTLVLMADGSKKPISKIRVGDVVLATDPLTGRRSARKVTHVWAHADHIVRLNVEGEWLTTTEDHPFWNETDREWQPAEQLDLGDAVGTRDGRIARVRNTNLRRSSETTAVYNLTVAGEHTYHVGGAGLLVHNTCAIKSRFSDDPGLVREAQRAGRSVQDDIDRLTNQLAEGNLTPGIGNRSLGGGLHEARSRSGARVIFRNTSDGVEILAKASKQNQDRVLRRVFELYGR